MREAVAAIFVCERDVFVIRRQDYLKAFPGYFAFPGGKVDAEDEGQSHRHPLLDPHPPRQVNALVRELREELDFDLVQALERGLVGTVVHFGEAITPPFERLRFNAHFFRIELKQRPRFRTDAREIAWSSWLDHRELYNRYTAGRALMVVPIMNAVRTLAEDISATCAGPFNLSYDPERELPYLEPLRGVGIIPVPSNTLPPAKATNALLIGDERRILVDPSPAADRVYRQLLQTLDGRLPHAIFVSHHHPDHHEHAPRLARELGVPLFCSATTRADLQQVYAPAELAPVEVVGAGDELTRWLGQPVRCRALPGHDAGMLGLAPDNLAWFFVADLVQAGASVVIPEHGGDMAAYFSSLRSLIAAQPQVLIPSHGFPAGGTRLAEKALQHRMQREEQVRRCRAAGLTVEEIAAQLYADIAPGLQRFALQNIRQHIRKLEAEG